MEVLATCPPGNRTLEVNQALWEVAHGERERADFLAAYGHRADASWEVFSARWRRNPDAIEPLLVAMSGTEAPAERGVDQEIRVEAVLSELPSVVGPGRRHLLVGLTRLTRRYLLLRENQRFWFDHLLASLQAQLLAVGSHVLDDPRDVAMLTIDELTAVVDGSLELDPGVVVERRARWLADAEHEPPVFLRGDDAVASDLGGRRVQGLGVSPGRATGPVCVVRRPADAQRFATGDVLVARAADPSWTPLFLKASAVVLELGSRLSHGAVVAREYRVPCVVNVDGAARRFVDGQELTVDGTRGVVWAR